MGLDTKTYWLTDRQSQCTLTLTLTLTWAYGQKSKKKKEKKNLKFTCCKIVKQLSVILPGEYSNKRSVNSRTHKLFVALPGNRHNIMHFDLITRQYFCSKKVFNYRSLSVKRTLHLMLNKIDYSQTSVLQQVPITYSVWLCSIIMTCWLL
jgi:hypothetical protein